MIVDVELHCKMSECSLCIWWTSMVISQGMCHVMRNMKRTCVSFVLVTKIIIISFQAHEMSDSGTLEISLLS